MTAQSRLALTTYAPALVGNDDRTLAAVHGMKRALPGMCLEWEVSWVSRRGGGTSSIMVWACNERSRCIGRPALKFSEKIR